MITLSVGVSQRCPEYIFLVFGYAITIIYYDRFDVFIK